MRHAIWTGEDHFSLQGRPRYNMHASAVTTKREVLSVLFEFDQTKPIGKATNIRIEGDEVTAEIHWAYPDLYNDEILEELDYRLAGGYLALEWTEDTTTITKSELKYISVCPIRDVPSEKE